MSFISYKFLTTPFIFSFFHFQKTPGQPSESFDLKNESSLPLERKPEGRSGTIFSEESLASLHSVFSEQDVVSWTCHSYILYI